MSDERPKEPDDGCALVFFVIVFGSLILFVLVCLFVVWLVGSGRAKVG
jgi:hypothetical protein